MIFIFYQKPFQTKAKSQVHYAVLCKDVTLTAGHDLGHLKMKGSGRTLVGC